MKKINFFAYGTLMDEDIMALVVNQQFSFNAAKLDGYRCLKMIGKVYPGIVELEQASVQGLLYRGLSQEQIRLLDAYEGDEYVRRTVTVETTTGIRIQAETYVLSPGYEGSLDTEPWSFAEFNRLHRQIYLRQLKGEVR